MTEELLGRTVRLQDDRDFPLPTGVCEGQRVIIKGYEPRRGRVIVMDVSGQEWSVRAANLQDAPSGRRPVPLHVVESTATPM